MTVQLDLFHVDRVVDGVRLAASARRIRALSGCRFAKILGTGSGFTPREADPHRWAAMTVWDDAVELDRSSAYRRIRGRALEHGRLRLAPLRARGAWSRQAPFTPVTDAPTGPLAVLTRARVKPSQWRRFWSATPPVAADALASEGLLLALAIGEAPVGLQGTFSVWADERCLQDFAYGRSTHRAVIAQTASTQWYAEELFARFVVTSASGTWHRRPLPALLALPPPDGP